MAACSVAGAPDRKLATLPQQPRMPVYRLAVSGISKRIAASFNRAVTKVFDNADTNKDGMVDLQEVYEMVLKLYVQINRQAPINPPKRAVVDAIFANADKDRSGRLDRNEFVTLASTLCARAIIRLVSHKTISVIVAPLLAVWFAEILTGERYAGHRFLQRSLELATRLVPTRFHKLVLTKTFLGTLITVMLVASLGNIVIAIVDYALNKLHSLPIPHQIRMEESSSLSAMGQS